MQNYQNSTQDFNWQEVYPCPVCRHGKISTITLMDAFACSFCSHIFTANLEQKILKMADSQLPLSWRWNGKNWKSLQAEGVNFSGVYLVVGIIFVMLPPIIIGVATYLFPPLPGSQLSWFPIFWTIISFFAHLTCLIWLVLEYYQFPLGLYLQAIRRHIFD